MQPATSTLPTADIKDSILDAVGHTPLVRVSRLAAGLTPQVLVKVEALNPGGSIKDRAALSMIDAAERSGSSSPAARSSRPPLATPASASPWPPPEGLSWHLRDAGQDVARKDRPLSAYGAEVVICPTNVAPEDPES